MNPGDNTLLTRWAVLAGGLFLMQPVWAGSITYTPNSLFVNNSAVTGSPPDPWHITGNLSTDSGYLTIQGSTVNIDGEIYINEGSSGQSDITLDQNSSVVVGTTLIVGDTGNGSLLVEGGSSLTTNGGVVIGNSVTGTVTVTGAGSSWTVNGNPIYVGGIYYGGTGTLSIEDSGLINASSVVLGNSSPGNNTLNLGTSGVLATNYVEKGAGTGSAVINFSGGILRATADSTSASSFLRNFSPGSISIGSGGAYIDTNGHTVYIDNTSGIFTGTGGLTKQGLGDLTVSGSGGNTWGNTTVSAGTLNLDSYTQSSGQTLTIGAAGTSSYGKLNVTNTASFNAGANLAVNVASANTLANGQVLSGVVSAGTLNASTFNVTDNSALFNFGAVVTSGSNGTVDLTVSRSASSIYDSVQAYSLTPAYGGARVLDTWLDGTPTGDQANVVTAFGKLPDQSSVARATEQTLPQNSGPQAMLGTLSAIDRLFSGRFAPGATGVSTGDEMLDKQVWIKPFGSHADQSDQNNASGFSSHTWGMALGYEGDVGKTRLGLAYAYANTHVSGNTDLSGTDSGTQIDTHVLGLYGSLPLNAANDLGLGFQADTGWNSGRSTRDLNFGGLNRTADGSYGTWSAHAGLSLSKIIPLNASNLLVPALRMDYTRLRSQAYGETGAGALDLNVDAKTTQALVFGIDGRLIHAIDEHSQIEASLGVGYDAVNDAGDIVAAYAGAPSQSFLTSGVQHSPWVLRGGLGYTYKTGKGSSVSLRYDAEGRTGYLNQSAMIRAAWRF